MVKESKDIDEKQHDDKNNGDYDSANLYFNCTDRERAAFEAGIKLGSIYHQFVGAPIGIANVKYLERAIEESVKIQPFVESVVVNIEKKRPENKKHEYDYLSLTGEMLNVKLTIKYKDSTAIAKLNFFEDLNYPLMYISSLK